MCTGIRSAFNTLLTTTTLAYKTGFPRTGIVPALDTLHTAATLAKTYLAGIHITSRAAACVGAPSRTVVPAVDTQVMIAPFCKRRTGTEQDEEGQT